MEPVAVTPTTVDALLGLVLGAAALVVTAGVPVILFWLRNALTKLDVAHTLLVKQQKDLEANTETTEAIEKQTNGSLAQARDDAMKALAIAKRLKDTNEQQKWIIAELQKTEEGRRLIDQIMQSRRADVAVSAYDELMARLLKEAS